MKMILPALMLLAFTASAEETAPKPWVLTLLPDFLEKVDNIDSRDACVRQGIEYLTKFDTLTGFNCGRGRAWIAPSEVPVRGGSR